MADVFIPFTKTIAQYEIRVPNFVAYNNLDVSVSDPLNKYSFVINRVAEPQDSDHVQVGSRIPLQPHTMNIGDVAEDMFTAAGITASGLQILALVSAVMDAHKGDGLTTNNIDVPNANANV